MNNISKHFVSDETSQLVLDPNDWTKEQYQAFLDIFGFREAERIVLTEFKVDAYAARPKEITDAEWVFAYDYLNMVIAEYTNAGMRGLMPLYDKLLPMKRRFDAGIRTKELYDEIMNWRLII